MKPNKAKLVEMVEMSQLEDIPKGKKTQNSTALVHIVALVFLCKLSFLFWYVPQVLSRTFIIVKVQQVTQFSFLLKTSYHHTSYIIYALLKVRTQL